MEARQAARAKAVGRVAHGGSPGVDRAGEREQRAYLGRLQRGTGQARFGEQLRGVGKAAERRLRTAFGKQELHFADQGMLALDP